LAGDDLPIAALQSWLATADLILAADGGADLVLAAGFAPAIVIGDLDSLEASRDGFAEIRHVEDQSSTDCDKLLGLALEMGLTGITLACVEGSRPDHALATLQSAARSSLDVRLVFRRGLGWLVRPGNVYRVPAQGRVSLLPLVACEQVNLTGVRWPLDSVSLEPTGLTSISNHATESFVEASLSKGVAFMFAEGSAEPAW
jgi:thiamine pyrophosphokinase